MELLHARLVRTMTCANGCKCDYAICGDQDEYLKKHPDFRAFAIYEAAEGFVNSYMDIFGRDAKFERVEIDESYPDYLREHLDEYEYLVMKPVSKGRQKFIRVFMKMKRFCRKAVRRVRRFFGEDV